MQWSAARNGGFSTAPRRKLANPPIAHGCFGFRRVNVASQLDDQDSTLARFRRLVQDRRAAPEIGRAPWRVVPVDHRAVLALRYEDTRGAVLVAANLTDQTARVRIPLDGAVGARDVTRGCPVETCRDALPLELGPYGHRWLRFGRGRRAAE
jgi:maltose alpha-D-glucosyltransferase/alpha-amylase